MEEGVLDEVLRPTRLAGILDYPASTSRSSTTGILDRQRVRGAPVEKGALDELLRVVEDLDVDVALQRPHLQRFLKSEVTLRRHLERFLMSEVPFRARLLR